MVSLHLRIQNLVVCVLVTVKYLEFGDFCLGFRKWKLEKELSPEFGADLYIKATYPQILVGALPIEFGGSVKVTLKSLEMAGFVCGSSYGTATRIWSR
ncbi:hypothetical protein AVEN_51253-1 [Araneus ventricosus]|uniref:Uncharacterized protein n=1 Tax=Araneus ventricosus TaxID=182803 RepID=A0A4Y1ZX06_ARAVE|nr:hypothetical protein AVEN_51253-1 [Araneus ventricosus]